MQAPDVLDLIPAEEAKLCTRKVFIADSKLSLGSALLKRLYVSQALGITWDDVRFGRRGDPKHGKPAALLPDGSFAPLDFNISHQAGLVALIGWKPDDPKTFTGQPAQVGVDLVCPHERDDYRTIDSEGFDGWIDIYEEIFSDEERFDMKYNVDSVTLLDGQVVGRDAIGRGDRCVRRGQTLTATLPSDGETTFDSELLIDAKLRRFYTYWCYKEAYIKLTGEALMAPWLKQLQFHNVKSPNPGTQPRCSVHGVWGEKVNDVEVSLYHKQATDIKMAIQAYEEHSMIATAAKGADLPDVPSFKRLDLEADVLSYARKTGAA